MQTVESIQSAALWLARNACIRVANHELFEQYIRFRIATRQNYFKQKKKLGPVEAKTLRKWIEQYDQDYNRNPFGEQE